APRREQLAFVVAVGIAADVAPDAGLVLGRFEFFPEARRRLAAVERAFEIDEARPVGEEVPQDAFEADVEIVSRRWHWSSHRPSRRSRGAFCPVPLRSSLW